MAEEVSGGLSTFAKVLHKSWLLILVIVATFGSVSIVGTRMLTKVYLATAMIEYDPGAIRPLNGQTGGDLALAPSYWDNREYYETQFWIIRSERVLGRAARDLGLAAEKRFAGGDGRPPASHEEITAALRERITVEPVKGSRLVLLKVEDSDPARARRICNAVKDAYIEQNLENKVNETQDAILWLNGQLDTLAHELSRNEREIHEFKQKHELPSTSINEASNMLRLELEHFDTALSHTLTRKQEIRARFTELSKVKDDDPADLPSSELLANTSLSALRSRYQQAVEDRETLRNEGKGDNHPAVRVADGKVAVTRAALLREVKNLKGALSHDLAIIEHQEAGEANLYEGARKRAIDLNLQDVDFRRLDRAREQNEKLYSLLLVRMKEADLARMMRANNVRQVDPALEPQIPIRPHPVVNFLIALGAGLLIGVLVAWTRVQLDSSIKVPDDVEEKLGLTFIGLLPEHDARGELGAGAYARKLQRPRRGMSAATPELVVHEHPLSPVGEAVRSVRTNLMFMNPDRPHRTLLVTSAVPAEGKTTVACSIAVSMAQGGLRTVIIDCDLRRPRLHRIFDRVGDPGVTSLIVGEATLDDVAKPTQVDNLYCIPAGPVPPNPADMLHSERFRQFLADASERFDRVIIDSPPVVAVTDAAIIATLVDSCLFVIRAFKTPLALTRRGLRALHDVDAPIAGALLNAVDFTRFEYSYNYGQTYGYAYGSRREEEPPQAAAAE